MPTPRCLHTRLLGVNPTRARPRGLLRAPRKPIRLRWPRNARRIDLRVIREVHNQVAHRYPCDRNTPQDRNGSVRAARSFNGGLQGRPLADGERSRRILSELRHHPEFMSMVHEVSRFGKSYHVVDLRIHREAEGNPLEICTRMQGVPGWAFGKQEGESLDNPPRRRGSLGGTPRAPGGSTTLRESREPCRQAVLQVTRRLKSGLLVRRRMNHSAEGRQ
jgi:hypothetical protein